MPNATNTKAANVAIPVKIEPLLVLAFGDMTPGSTAFSAVNNPYFTKGGVV